jgi:hypothetical protein
VSGGLLNSKGVVSSWRGNVLPQMRRPQEPTVELVQNRFHFGSEGAAFQVGSNV